MSNYQSGRNYPREGGNAREGGGYNREGGSNYSREGSSYNREGGYNRGGGYNREGGSYSREGGYNRGGGYNREGGSSYNREGGYNRGGGYNREGGSSYNREGGSYNREGGSYNREGGYNRGGGYNREGGSSYNREGGYNRGGGYNREGGSSYNREGGYNRGGGYNREGGSSYNREGGYNRGGGYNREGGSSYNRGGGYNREGGSSYNREGGYNRGGGGAPRGRSGPGGGFNRRPMDKRSNSPSIALQESLFLIPEHPLTQDFQRAIGMAKGTIVEVDEKKKRGYIEIEGFKYKFEDERKKDLQRKYPIKKFQDKEIMFAFWPTYSQKAAQYRKIDEAPTIKISNLRRTLPEPNAVEIIGQMLLAEEELFVMSVFSASQKKKYMVTIVGKYPGNSGDFIQMNGELKGGSIHYRTHKVLEAPPAVDTQPEAV